jgi:23S rRNA-/tRNA-specific pseudouridylate synthase
MVLRIDRVLLRHLRRREGHVRAIASRSGSRPAVLINGRRRRAGLARAAGDELRVPCRDSPSGSGPQAQALDLDILYEDDECSRSNKPAAWCVHPLLATQSGTLDERTAESRATGRPDRSRPCVGRPRQAHLGHRARHQAPEFTRLADSDESRSASTRITCRSSRQAVAARGTFDLALDRDPVGSPQR